MWAHSGFYPPVKGAVELVAQSLFSDRKVSARMFQPPEFANSEMISDLGHTGRGRELISAGCSFCRTEEVVI